MAAACWQNIERTGTLANTASPHDSVAEFVARLEKLDAGSRAALKRNAGRLLDESRNVYQTFFSVLPRSVTNPKHQEAFFLVATLYVVGTRRHDSTAPRRQQTPPRNLGASLRRLRQRVQSDSSEDRQISLDKRVNTLLEADREQLSFRLHQLVRLLASSEETKEAAINWPQLLHDVLQWERDGRKVQRRWAEAYYVGINEASEMTMNDTPELSIVATTEESNEL